MNLFVISLLLSLILANDRLSVLLASFVSISDSNMAISWVMTPFSLSVSIISGWPCEISPNTLKPSDKISISFKTRLSTVRAQLTRISPLSPTILAKGTNPTRVDASSNVANPKDTPSMIVHFLASPTSPIIPPRYEEPDIGAKLEQ